MGKQDDERYCAELEDVCEQIREAMELRGVPTIAALARATQMDPRVMSELVRGKRMSIKQLVRISNALDCELEITLKTRGRQRRDYLIEWDAA